MGKIEDLMVYSKLMILLIISYVLISNNHITLLVLIHMQHQTFLLSILIAASITFVDYEGFQLVINAVKEMEIPEKNIPQTIYTALFVSLLIAYANYRICRLTDSSLLVTLTVIIGLGCRDAADFLL